MRFGPSSPTRLAVAGCCAVALLATAGAAQLPARTLPVQPSRGQPSVLDFRLSAAPVSASSAGAARLSWRVRSPRTLAVTLNRWDDADGWLPAGTYVGGRFLPRTSPALASGSRTLAQLAAAGGAALEPGRWRAILWAALGEVDGTAGSVRRTIEFDVVR